MKYLIEAIARDLPKEVKNYQLIKRQDIYIPYREIGVECLTKETADINLFYETILKFLEIGVCDINEIALIMGTEYKLLKEVVVDMIEEQYISTSQNRLFMTKRGKEALKSRKTVTIQKKNINQVMVNMITGAIEEGNHITTSQVSRLDLCLNEVFSISKDFLESNYAKINELYQKEQIESSIFKMRYTSRELYKILDISYDKLCFKKEELLVYKNNESDDYEFVISKDVGEGYINAFYDQIKDIVCPGLENLFERNRDFVRSCELFGIVENEEKMQTNKLKEMLFGCDAITDEICQEFVKKRSIIDNKEIEKYFVHHKEVQYDGIIISSKRMKNLLSNTVVNMLNEDSKKKIVIIYDANEYDIENYLLRRFSASYKDERILLFKEEKPKEFICFYPNVLIDLKESITYVFNHPMVVLEGTICFDSQIVKDMLDSIIEEKRIELNDIKKDVNSFKRKKSYVKDNRRKNRAKHAKKGI